MKTILIILAILAIASWWAWWGLTLWIRKVCHEEQAPLRDAVSPDPNVGVFMTVCPACNRAWSREGQCIQGTHYTTLLIIEWGVEARVCSKCRLEAGDLKSQISDLKLEKGRWVPCQCEVIQQRRKL